MVMVVGVVMVMVVGVVMVMVEGMGTVKLMVGWGWRR